MNARLNLVRWILVVTLGCSLGLLLVYVAAWVRPAPDLSNANDMLVTHSVRHRESPFRLSEQEIEQELTGVIEGQLAALRKDDYPDAYKYAAAGIKAQFPLPSFERMVRQGFPFLAQSSSVQFGVIVDNGNQAMVNVTIRGTAGRARHYQYILLREPTGWKIGGVNEVKQQGAGTTV